MYFYPHFTIKTSKEIFTGQLFSYSFSFYILSSGNVEFYFLFLCDQEEFCCEQWKALKRYPQHCFEKVIVWVFCLFSNNKR